MIWIVVLYLAFAIANAFWLRRRLALLQRLNDLNWQALVLIDVALAFPIFWTGYVAGLLKTRPAPLATLSALCGFYAARGVLAARIGAMAIDRVFFTLTSERDHCAREAAKLFGR